jgi:hypothetical protein
MLRLIDIRDKIDVDGVITANKLLEMLVDMRDIYNLFNLVNDTDANQHITVGIQSRRYQTDRLDAYILVGLRVMANKDMSYENEIALAVNDALCKLNCTIDITEEHYHYNETDDNIVMLYTNIIWDMEDVAEEGNIDDVMF